ncbi:putative long-chain base protein 3 protein [Phaeoacremonium minimum UCRPA7]|uniref:Putative long-chain base protein 3 protein n=1 Tax=Phaeoacremonium minimum (strain UCR-PA7) TaxID=1286976 RepID=R8BM61_PHAM7|nr:putative long-chain base protein 3 protein [Phaeoacremonium minimum UCRPA7]EOO00466.1 putative long-chain base protein 3 protein [Phaeoacremonium minimum UCRPA7]
MSKDAPNNAKPTEKEVIDAGLRSLDHYKRALPKWRYNLRQRMLPLVRWETPYLAYFQDKARTPALDSYFAITANLGTHTFFMIGLPILFWCGFSSFGKGLVHILAEGVFFSGWIKDMVSLPRPLSPPLHRITMSGSVALEYGFPSTHSANAVSVAVYAVLCLRSADNPFSPTTKILLESLGYFYTLSIIIGRLYCGMHGFLDVFVGSLMGAIISLVEFYYGPALDLYMHESGWSAPIIAALVIIVLVRVHPEPVDDCPCFDDSVAFAGVMIGLEVGTWHVGRTQYAWTHNEPSLHFQGLGWPGVVTRIVFGVAVIVAWREVMKPTLLKTLPHLFRVIETSGMSLPRRFFMPASEYKNIPDLLRLKTDNVLPSVSDLPNFVRSIRHPVRGRSISIGPQSAADAYETLAYRERRRRESVGSNGSVRSKSSIKDLREKANGSAVVGDDPAGWSTGSGAQHSPFAEYEQMMGQGKVYVNANRSPSPDGVAPDEPDLYIVSQDELGEKEMFQKLVKPRVRYDVEVVTKLVVYTGIGWLAVEIIPVIFEFVGLGVSHLQPA